MNDVYITWPIDKDTIAVYTEMPDVKVILKKMFGKLTTYEKNGRVYAWQIIIPQNRLKLLDIQVKRIFLTSKLIFKY